MISNIKTTLDGDQLVVDFTWQPVMPVHYITATAMLEPVKMSWHDALQGMYLRQKDTAELTEKFQQLYPGNYVIEEFYNAKLQRFDVRLKFDDPKHETFWMIKHQ